MKERTDIETKTNQYIAGQYDLIVVGGGHAGCEAALAGARMGAKTLLITLNVEAIALAPCNPAIGGPAKSVVVREIDALGGAMAEITDQSQIQIRMLNTGRGAGSQGSSGSNRQAVLSGIDAEKTGTNRGAGYPPGRSGFAVGGGQPDSGMFDSFRSSIFKPGSDYMLGNIYERKSYHRRMGA